MHTPLVTGAQPGRQVIVLAAAGAQGLLAIDLDRQRVLQATLGCGITESDQFVLSSLDFSPHRICLLCCSFNSTAEFSATRVQAALGKGGLLCPPLQAALLLTAFSEPALSHQHPLIELGVALLGVRQLHVELIEAGFGRNPTLLQFVERGVHLSPVRGDLRTAGARLVGQLGQAKGFNLQVVSPTLALRGLASQHQQPL